MLIPVKDNAKGHCSFVHNFLQFSPLSYTVWVAFLSINTDITSV